MDGEDAGLWEEEVPCLFMSREPKLNDAPTVAIVLYDGKEETILVDWPQEEPAEIGLPAVLEVNREMEDASPISVAEFLREQANETLCLSARLEVGDGKSFFDVNCHKILVGKAPLDRAIQWYVPEFLQARLLYLSQYARYGGHSGAFKMCNTLRRN